MKIIFKIICITFVLVILSNLTVVNAETFIDKILKGGNDWKPTAQSADSPFLALQTGLVEFIENDIIEGIQLVGNLIFFMIGILLGAKYIWSSVEGKSAVKETLPTFLVATVFFYTAFTLKDIAQIVLGDVLTANDFQTIQNNIWVNFSVVIQMVAFAGIIFLGLKYMFSNADTKADIKKDMFPFFIGLIMVFSFSSVIKFLVTSARQVIK